MRVLQIHNEYNHLGGEDVIVNLEHKLLVDYGLEVKLLKFNNKKLKLPQVLYNKNSYDLVKTAIVNFKPDILHVHNLFYEATPSILKCAFDFKIPTVMTLHNYRLICPNGLLLREDKPCTNCVDKKFAFDSIRYSCFQNSKVKSAVLATILGYHHLNRSWNKYVSKFIVLTPFSKQVFLNSVLNVSQDKIVIKPNSVDDLKKGIKERKDYLFVGRLSNEKGIETAIKAFNMSPSLKLHVIGGGPLETELKRMAKDNIAFHGIRDKREIKEMLNACKALIFPSLCYEGLPNTILEAFSSGTPVIASNIENINTIVENGKTGVLFAAGDSVSLNNKIIEFQSLNCMKLGDNAREMYLNLYTHRQNTLSLLQIYKDLCI